LGNLCALECNFAAVATTRAELVKNGLCEQTKHPAVKHVHVLFAAMKQAAQYLVGKHDFKSFAATHTYEMESTVRTLTRCDVKRSGMQYTFVIEGDGFLYKMCRGVVGTLVQVGFGKFSPGDIKAMLARTDRRAAGMSAPAHGLVLWKVFYKKPQSRRDAKKAEK
jgi:tRNA pseudouridine(38-40) synthase